MKNDDANKSKKSSAANTPLKKGLHPANPHRKGYDFDALTAACPGLGPFVAKNRYGNRTINFADAAAVRMLNRALLKSCYGIDYWDIPDNYLCPPIPGRADYIHYMADLLASSGRGDIPNGENIRVLDIGTGANCIYPLIGNRAYGWRFVGSDIDPISVASAENILRQNSILKNTIEIRPQRNAGHIFKGIIAAGECFDFTMCNPPFHASEENARAANERKRGNLSIESPSKLNFGGQANELVTQGGEASFVRRMIDESSRNQQACLWFSTLVSKKNTMEGVYKTLKRVKALRVKTINMEQGQKTSRVIAWSFFDEEGFKRWTAERWA